MYPTFRYGHINDSTRVEWLNHIDLGEGNIHLFSQPSTISYFNTWNRHKLSVLLPIQVVKSASIGICLAKLITWLAETTKKGYSNQFYTLSISKRWYGSKPHCQTNALWIHRMVLLCIRQTLETNEYTIGSKSIMSGSFGCEAKLFTLKKFKKPWMTSWMKIWVQAWHTQKNKLSRSQYTIHRMWNCWKYHGLNKL